MTKQVGVCFGDMYAVDYEWVWNDRLVQGEVTILVGDSGIGKGYTEAEIIRAVTTGGSLPGDTMPRDPRSVILISLEEDPECTTIHKLKAAGANLGKVFDLSEVDSKNDYSTSGKRQFQIEDDIAAVRACIKQQRDVSLVIIDPLTAATGLAIGSNAKARDVMSALRQLARDTGVSVLVVTHPVKGRSTARGNGLNLKDRTGGSKGLTDAARLVIGVERDPESSELLMFVIKSNICPDDAPPQRYRLTSAWPKRVEWLHEVEDGATDGSEPTEGCEAHKILTTLREYGEPIGGMELAVLADSKYSTVRSALKRLREAGLVSTTERGSYVAEHVDI